MIRSIYAAASGMISQERKLNVLGNNITNADTDGFKQDSVILHTFGEALADRMNDNTPIGTLTAGTAVSGTQTDLSQGSLEQTDVPTNLAIEGDGFFAVEDGRGTGNVKYTRDGAFQIDTQGFLALSTGERLLGADGNPVYVGSDNFQVDEYGRVWQNGAMTEMIPLSTAGTDAIEKRNDGFYNINGAQQTTGRIEQGYLENSNVSTVDAMAGLMQAARSYQSDQQALQVANDTFDKLVTQVGLLK